MSRVWFNGKIVEGPIAIDSHDRGLTLGDGLFETILVLNRVALWGGMHLARMAISAQELGLPVDRPAIGGAVDTLLREADAGLQVLRVTLTRGAAPRGLAGSGAAPALLVTLDPFDAALMFQPVSLVTASIRRSPSSPSTRLKTLSYIDNIAAAREAAGLGADDALLLNTAGAAACSTVANLFLLKADTLVTPARDQGILAGIMRQALMTSARQLGFAIAERAVQPAELLQADAVFLTNSLRFIRPVTSLDRQPLAATDLTTFIDALCQSARLQAGRDPRLI